jgi:hypothetical protein
VQRQAGVLTPLEAILHRSRNAYTWPKEGQAFFVPASEEMLGFAAKPSIAAGDRVGFV